MKVLIDINHPAHVHFFKGVRGRLMAAGHEVIVTASRKDVAFDLLRSFQIPYVDVGSYGGSVWQKILRVPVMARRILHIAKQQQPDVMIGLASSRITHAGYFLGIPTCVFTDTEHAWLQIALYRPFATYIITPSYFKRSFGRKHLKYKGFHDLAYLHPEAFRPDPAVLAKYDLSSGERFFIVRFISWKASHDVGHHGLSKNGRARLIKKLEVHGRVLSCEEDGSAATSGNRIEPMDLHHLMADASMYAGEGGTMATEAAVLGIPSILINSLKAGVFDALDKTYGLLFQSTDESAVFQKMDEWLGRNDLHKEFMEKRTRLLSENTDPNPEFIKWIEMAAKKMKRVIPAN